MLSSRLASRASGILSARRFASTRPSLAPLPAEGAVPTHAPPAPWQRGAQALGFVLAGGTVQIRLKLYLYRMLTRTRPTSRRCLFGPLLRLSAGKSLLHAGMLIKLTIQAGVLHEADIISFLSTDPTSIRCHEGTVHDSAGRASLSCITKRQYRQEGYIQEIGVKTISKYWIQSIKADWVHSMQTCRCSQSRSMFSPSKPQRSISSWTTDLLAATRRLSGISSAWRHET